MTATEQRRLAAGMNMRCTKTDRRNQGKLYLQSNYLRVKPCRFLAVWLATFGTAFAQDAQVHRCIGSHGEPTFTDQPCAVSIPSEPAGISLDARVAAPASTQTCPISPEDLRTRVAAAFASRDAVSLSGLFLWGGHSRGSASASLRDLSTLLGEPLISIDIEADGIEASTQSDSGSRATHDPPPVHVLVIRSGREMDRVPREAVTRYAMTARQGCWWLRLPD